MIIKVNGKDETVNSRLSLAELIKDKNLMPERIAVEYNLRVTKKEEWQKIILQEGDSIEIISFMGGG